jgi:hypothetical protein
LLVNLEKKLQEIENSIDVNSITIEVKDSSYVPIQLAYFELDGYKQLIMELNRTRNAYTNYNDKELLIECYRKIYLSSKKMYLRSYGTWKRVH